MRVSRRIAVITRELKRFTAHAPMRASRNPESTRAASGFRPLTDSETEEILGAELLAAAACLSSCIRLTLGHKRCNHRDLLSNPATSQARRRTNHWRAPQLQRTAAITHGDHMSNKSIETPKASSKPDDLIKPKTKGGKTELTELSEEELSRATGGTGDYLLELKGPQVKGESQ